MTGVQRYFIRRVEKGRASPSPETLERCANALGVHMWELFYTGEKWQPRRHLTDLHGLAQESGKAGPDARFFSKLRPLLARIPEKDRALFLSFAKGLPFPSDPYYPPTTIAKTTSLIVSRSSVPILPLAISLTAAAEVWRPGNSPFLTHLETSTHVDPSQSCQ